MKILEEREWRMQAEAHACRVAPWVEPRLQRSSRHIRHPVDDFLFEYYPYRPAHLARWHPGLGLGLRGAEAYLRQRDYMEVGGVVTADVRSFMTRRGEGLEWIRNLLAATQERRPAFGCAGLHEWAMVYRTQEVRHNTWPLRLPPAQIADVVDSLPILCTHYDAFRFFTPHARPLNRFQPTRESQPAHEQPGCLHANMDLYKWASKLSPLAPSELVADCFALAREIRTLDMRASPYDLSALGLQPVCIENASGRAEYEAEQRRFAQCAVPLRSRLLALCDQARSIYELRDEVSAR